MGTAAAEAKSSPAKPAGKSAKPAAPTSTPVAKAKPDRHVRFNEKITFHADGDIVSPVESATTSPRGAGRLAWVRCQSRTISIVLDRSNRGILTVFQTYMRVYVSLSLPLVVRGILRSPVQQETVEQMVQRVIRERDQWERLFLHELSNGAWLNMFTDPQYVLRRGGAYHMTGFI